MIRTSDNVQKIVNEIIDIIHTDEQISHCRVNIINGVGDMFSKYKRNLSGITETDLISVRFYSTVHDVHKDLFYDKEFMANDWFNLFVFNVNNGDEQQLKKEIIGIDIILHELSARFDSKFYATTIVSALSQERIYRSFETTTGEECPIKSLRYLDINFDGEEILTYMYKILHTHSTEFLTKWRSALDKLEHFSKSSHETVERGEISNVY
jgi:hypothetical protein